MKVVVKRVKSSKVAVRGTLINKIAKGLNILVGFSVDDTMDDIDYIVRKVVNLRIFDDDEGIMNRSIVDIQGEILSISQFTLQAETKKGNRPSYAKAMKGSDSIKLYEEFNSQLNGYVKTYPGVFGEEMEVDIVNDGPVTIVIDSKDK